MKTLIYTAATGHPVFRAMARECTTSSRRRGYRGDFLVLTDAPEAFAVPGGAEGFDVARLPEPAAPAEAVLCKAALARLLDAAALAAYDRVLYVDADCVFLRDPDALLRFDDIRLACEGQGVSPYNLLFFETAERARFTENPDPRVNTGTILMPGREAFAFLSEWEAHWRACPCRETARTPEWSWCDPMLMDQPAMQRMLYRGDRAWNVFPPGLVRFPLYEPTEGATLLHFCGPLNGGKTPHVRNKESLLDRMRRANSGDDSSMVSSGSPG